MHHKVVMILLLSILCLNIVSSNDLTSWISPAQSQQIINISTAIKQKPIRYQKALLSRIRGYLAKKDLSRLHRSLFISLLQNMENFEPTIYHPTNPVPITNIPDRELIFGGFDITDIEKTIALHLQMTGYLQDVLGAPMNPHNPDAMETVAFPGTKITVIKATTQPNIVEVKVESYETDYPLYTDHRLLKDQFSSDQIISEMPTQQEILERIKEAIGTPYVRGGAYPEGIKSQLESLGYRPDETKTGDKTQEQLAIYRKIFFLQGVDCSGLLHYATKGKTPRNTSDLIKRDKAKPIAIADRNTGWTLEHKISSLKSILRPLDIIIFPGHMLIVYDDNHIIDSRRDDDISKGGTKLHTTQDALTWLMSPREGQNQGIERPFGDKQMRNLVTQLSENKKYEFMVLRWHSDFIND